MAMFAGACCTAVRDLFEPPPSAPTRGRVVHTGDGSVGVLVGPHQRMVVLDARPGPESLPCSVLTPTLPTGPDGGAVRLGEPVELSADGLHGQGWAVPLVRWWSPARVPAGARCTPPVAGLAATGALDAVVVRALQHVVEALLLDDVHTAVDQAASVIGRGPGSTPAADDAVAGLLLAARSRTAAGDTAALDETAAQVVALAPARTTALSAELLRHAASGLATETAVRAVLEPSGANRARVLCLGATSGAALLAGIDLVEAAVERRRAAA
jgi:hypothetical protein